MFSSLVAIVPMVNSQRLKAIAVTGKSRSPILPNIPTLIESGYPEYVSGSWYGLLAPAGTNKEIITKINQASREALQNSTMREQLIQEGAEPVGGSPLDFKKYIQNELDQTTRLLKKQKIVIN
jgi:tripartite-type tricarboxylate transporter receptor subunit TctC